MRIVEIYYPAENNIKFYSMKVPHNRATSIYESVEVFKKMSNPEFVLKDIGEKIPLKEIINLHNTAGIQSLKRIKSMIKDIKSGKKIFSDDGFPNVKLVKSKDNKWILFDGHHTLLAYMAEGKEFLHEIDHIIVKNQDEEHVNSEEISVFFGEHADKIKDWKEHVINWQASKEEQLCKRIQNNMGELLDSIRVRFK